MEEGFKKMLGLAELWPSGIDLKFSTCYRRNDLLVYVLRGFAIIFYVAAVSVAPCPSVCLPVRPSLPCLRFSRKGKAVGSNF